MITEQEIITQYLNGKSISSLHNENPEISYRKIQKILIDNNVTIRGGRKKKTLSPEKLEEFRIDLYNGVIFDELSKKYNMDPETLKRIANENHFSKRNNNRINKRIKSDYFSIIDSPEKAYWIGFLFTDGSVNYNIKSEKQQPRIRFQLQENDKEILEKYKEDLGLDCKLIYDKREGKHCYSVEFVDSQIFNDLAKFGIVPNKTYKTIHLQYQDISEQFLPAYVLGLFDGDGCLTYSNDFSTDVTFGFTTYYESIAKDFQELIDKLINKKEPNKPIYASAWHINWRGRLQVLSILDLLYNNCPRHLERKYQKYLLLKQSLN